MTLTSTTKTAYTFKQGEEVNLARAIRGFEQFGLKWHEPIAERMQATPTRTRILRDTTIEITMTNSLD